MRSAAEVDLTSRLWRFRCASRELWNCYFMANGVGEQEAYYDVRDALFVALVLRPAGLAEVRYGIEPAPIMVHAAPGAVVFMSRGVGSGSWELCEGACSAARMQYMSYFDWNEDVPLDYQYVRAVIVAHSDADVLGKQVLLDSANAEFSPIK